MTLSLDLLLGFALFALVTSITPGPNNTMLLASGVHFGFNRTIPHMLGITCGFFVLVVAVGLGLGAVFQTYPLLYSVLRYVGAAYLLYLAWKIAHSGPVSAREKGQSKPISYLGAAILIAAQDANWGPIQYKGELHDRATYRYFWSVLQRAQATNLEIPETASARFFR